VSLINELLARGNKILHKFFKKRRESKQGGQRNVPSLRELDSRFLVFHA
jgi:hypothetical protein